MTIINDNIYGVGIVEVYDANLDSEAEPRNISTRGFVQRGDNVLIGGFILGSKSTPAN